MSHVKIVSNLCPEDAVEGGVTTLSQVMNIEQLIFVLRRCIDDEQPVGDELLACLHRLEEEFKDAAWANLFQINGLCRQGFGDQLGRGDHDAAESYRVALAYISTFMEEGRDKKVKRMSEAVLRKMGGVLPQDVFDCECCGY